MAASSFFAVAAGSWGVAMSLAPILQIRTMRRAGSSAGVSIAYLSVLLVGFVLWLAYGISITNPAIIITNTSALVVDAITIGIAWNYRRPGGVPSTS